ncbi:hypothetical protein J2S40_003582 [Nocardioides luteus]|uniref:Uncharacterized protein n=1 Tax=Nocardioides luteus TaxID=1844 RepID=A0ABQ5SX69_9ACTN|nr:hypothetical protein [Nocardioides luteus]MDR7312524.1 hypothetical protein [Nocardioides luteus]GGR45742.1 hypothetical protein GCM10010197_09080 [Nocardioides luteus]GLJ68772.1 hypothetical protein GCM10017579_28080 [Nocardioides luteus]
MSKKVQTWSRTIDGHTHHLEVTGEIVRRFVWTVDGEEILDKKTADDRARLETKEHGSMLVAHSGLGTPRRATYFAPGEGLAGLAGVGGVDLTPEQGSRAAAYERKVIDHPRRYALVETLGGAASVLAGVVGAMVVAWIVSRISFPGIPLPDLPDLPDLPLPDLPSIPWPSIPWPDLPSLHVPDWLERIFGYAKYVWPIVLAFVLAQGEIRRRRKHAEASAAQAEKVEPSRETSVLAAETSVTSAETSATSNETSDSIDTSAHSADQTAISADLTDFSPDAGDVSADQTDVSAETGQRRGL